MIKPVDLESTVTLIHYGDPAIDESKSDIKAYLKVHVEEPERWREFIKPTEGQRFTEFVMGVLAPSLLARIEDDALVDNPTQEIRYNSLYWECFKHALRDIKHGPTSEITKDGRKSQGVPKVMRYGIEYVDPQWLEQVCIGKLKAAADFVGGAAYRWQRTLEGDRKNS